MAESREDNVRVMVRCRPFNPKEGNEGATEIIFIDKSMKQVAITQTDVKDLQGKKIDNAQRKYTFDAVYGKESTQIEVFDESVSPIIDNCLIGFNCTIFAYGQTGSGKTHTMMGYKGDRGMIPQSIQKVFDVISKASASFTYLVRASFYEIYNETIRDLMTNKGNLPVKETAQKGVWIEGLSEYRVNNEQEIDDLMVKGNSHRSVAATQMNATSSRSHSIFLVIVERMEDKQDGKDHIVQGKLNLVDLAGSERADKTGATGDRLVEGAKINQSLTCLGQVIQSLVDGIPTSHIAYRDSKLTHILKDGLGGNSKTLMVVAISPASTNYEETLSSLRYADRAKRIKNKAIINEDPKDAQIKQMKKQIEDLESKLMRYMGKIPDGAPAGYSPDEGDDNEIMNIDEMEIEIQQEIEKVQIHKKIQKTKKQMTDAEYAAYAAEQKKMEQEIKAKQEKAAKAKKNMEEIKAQLEAQQKSLLDKKKLEDDGAEKERLIRQTRQELAAQKQKEAEIKARMKAIEEARKEEETTFKNIGDEIEATKRKLEKYAKKKDEITEELDQLQSDHARERCSLQEDFQLIKKYYEQITAILESYVPKEIVEKLCKLCKYDKDTQTWSIPGMEKTGNRRFFPVAK